MLTNKIDFLSCLFNRFYKEIRGIIEVNIKLLCKKTYKSLLALMIMFSIFPQFTETVVAEETTIPVDQFATVDQLKSFNTNDNDGEVKAAKVYFGNNNQQWWIAGSQNGNITLFAATPLATYQQFEPNETQKWPCLHFRQH